MAQLVIKGHLTRGKEVIKILEMLGGKVSAKLSGDAAYSGYYINSKGNVDYKPCASFDDAIQCTLEDFLKKYPYKVGDYVYISSTDYQGPGIIQKLHWCNDTIRYFVESNRCSTYWEITELLPFEKKKKNVEEGVYAYNEINCYHQDFADKVQIRLGGDYEIQEEDGKTYIVKKKLTYPKTYEECCKILNIPSNGNIAYVGDWVYGGEYLEKHLDRLRKFQQLLICRDAYWKLAGDEMGLDKLWKPYNGQESCKKHVIQTVYDNITCLDTWCQTRNILEFPTVEMRDTFYENFKNTIEQCKELL